MMSRVYTAESSIQGTGVFSSAHFSPGEIILRIDDSRVVTDADPLDPAKGEFEHHCDFLSGGKVVLMQPPERFINHRCDPNTYIRTITGDRYVVALREIRPSDEITYDYCVNGDGDTAWDCSCGSPACRKASPLRLLPPAPRCPGPLLGVARRLVRRRAPGRGGDPEAAERKWARGEAIASRVRTVRSRSTERGRWTGYAGHRPGGQPSFARPRDSGAISRPPGASRPPILPRRSTAAWPTSAPTTTGGWSASSSSPGTAAFTPLSWIPPCIPTISGVGSGGG